MNAHTPFPAEPYGAATPAEAATARARAVAQRQLALLERLAEAGLQVALAVEREAKACTPEVPEARSVQGLAMAYARAARAVRLTVLLQSRVLRELEQVERQGAYNAPSDARRAAEARLAAGEERKVRIEKIIGRVAQASCDDDEAADALLLDASERLDDEDLYGDVLTRPMDEIVARICRDLGLDPDWGRLQQEAWAQAEMASGAEGSPFVTPHSREKGAPVVLSNNHAQPPRPSLISRSPTFTAPRSQSWNTSSHVRVRSGCGTSNPRPDRGDLS